MVVSSKREAHGKEVILRWPVLIASTQSHQPSSFYKTSRGQIIGARDLAVQASADPEKDSDLTTLLYPYTAALSRQALFHSLSMLRVFRNIAAER
jgi:hypothetical protein